MGVEGGAVRHVHILDRNGQRIFNRLVDDGGELLQFASGFGRVSRSEMKRNGWTLADGWPGHELPTDSNDPC